jgi:hypothetical protein
VDREEECLRDSHCVDGESEAGEKYGDSGVKTGGAWLAERVGRWILKEGCIVRDAYRESTSCVMLLHLAAQRAATVRLFRHEHVASIAESKHTPGNVTICFVDIRINFTSSCRHISRTPKPSRPPRAHRIPVVGRDLQTLAHGGRVPPRAHALKLCLSKTVLEAPLHVAMNPSRRSTSAVCASAYASARQQRGKSSTGASAIAREARGLCRLNPFACCCLSAERRDPGEQRRTVCTLSTACSPQNVPSGAVARARAPRGRRRSGTAGLAQCDHDEQRSGHSWRGSRGGRGRRQGRRGRGLP